MYNWKAYVAFNLNCFFENDGLLKVTRSHLHCKYVSMSESVQDGVVVATNHSNRK